METLLGIPLEGWKALSVWIFVLVAPWSYGLWFLHRLRRSGVPRWGGTAPPERKERTIDGGDPR